jgi:aromatic ring hydroxylase
MVTARRIPAQSPALRRPYDRRSVGHRTQKFFKPSYSARELMEARDAIAALARLSYDFMGRAGLQCTGVYFAAIAQFKREIPGWLHSESV